MDTKNNEFEEIKAVYAKKGISQSALCGPACPTTRGRRKRPQLEAPYAADLFLGNESSYRGALLFSLIAYVLTSIPLPYFIYKVSKWNPQMNGRHLNCFWIDFWAFATTLFPMLSEATSIISRTNICYFWSVSYTFRLRWSSSPAPLQHRSPPPPRGPLPFFSFKWPHGCLADNWGLFFLI